MTLTVKKELLLDLLAQVRENDSSCSLENLPYDEAVLEDIACEHVLAMYLAQKRQGLSIEDREIILLAICASLCLDLTIANLKVNPIAAASKDELSKVLKGLRGG